MPTHRVTPAATEVIRRGKAQGKSSRELAAILKDTLGIEIDQRTISRHAKNTPAKGKKGPRVRHQVDGAGPAGPPRPPPPPPPPRPEPDASLELNAGVNDLAPTLNEVAALEREVIRLQNILATGIPNRDRVALQAELRQSMKSIRLATSAAKKAQTVEDLEVAATVTKLKRFALRNVKDFGEAAETELADGSVPEVGRSAGSE